MGSAMQGVGVEELLDAVVAYLPDPLSLTKSLIQQRLSSATSPFYGLAFRNLHDKYRGLLTFIRIYRGTLKAGSTLYNINTGQRQKVGKVMEAYADELRDVRVGSEGNVVVVSGLSATATGDTLTLPAATDKEEMSLLPILQIPDPVYFCSLEAHSTSQQQALEEALAIIQKEDPSLKVSMEADIGQLVVCGMGELHLEVVRGRLKDQFGLETYMGPLQVAYKEAPTVAADHVQQASRDVQGTTHNVMLHLRLLPTAGSGAFKRLKVLATQEEDWTLPRDIVHAVENGVMAALSNGPSLSCPVVDVSVELLKLTTSRGVLPAMVAAAATHCVLHLLRQANCQVMEPLMSVAISVPMELVHEVIGDLAKRRALIKEVEVLDEESRIVQAETPLAEMLHFSRDIRTVTRGLASLEVQFSRYQALTADHLHQLQTRAY
ncbi:hypothetical protein RvY_18987 [Ramazzottius varieornatus]|uniref:Elongation factor EFG domain-containing protein n=1 Tax=Ramazzottius varieornatus TaxID=947166 RepID=A0A1D1W7R9_RAMVA|nr:hypothetical protein RvY_18987 [Ramazzottius varieornatus]